MTTTHATHLSPELLSAYLDAELAPRDRAQVEEHVVACPGCRARLDGMRRVVRTLGRLERAAPPPVLAHHVQRRIALEGRPGSLFERLEGRLSTFSAQSPLLVTFTVVLALAVFAYLFAWRVANQGGTVLVLPAPMAATGEVVERAEAREVGDRRFLPEGSGWREVGAEGAPAVTVACGTPEAAELLARHPWLAELPAGDGEVVFRDDERLVALRCPAGEGPVDTTTSR